MGLDVAFNRAAALQSGLVVRRVIRGDKKTISSYAPGGEYEDADAFAFWSEEIEVIEVPMPDSYWFDPPQLLKNDGDHDTIVVRANPWGRNYGPLTQWLKSHGIEWSEF